MPSEPKPIRIVSVELEAVPEHLELGSYENLWVVACRSGVPQAIVEADLSDSAPPLAEQLASVRALPAAPAPVAKGPLPTMSVVVPSIVRRLDDLDGCLAALDQLDYPSYEVIVADNRPVLPDDDPLPGLLARRQHVRSVRAPLPGVASARNAGALAATGEIVAMTDDDVRVEPGWLRAFANRFSASPELDGCTGLILPAELETAAQIYFERYYGGFAGERLFRPLTLQTGHGLRGRAQLIARDADDVEVRRAPLYGVGAYGAGANMAIRRDALLRLGGFDLTLGTGTATRGGEDIGILMDLLWAGSQLGYEPAAVVNHRHRRGYDELLQQLRAGGTGLTATLMSLVWQDPRHLLGLLVQVSPAVRRVLIQSLARLRGQREGQSPDEQSAEPLYPSELVRHELSGMPLGPLAYFRSRRITLQRLQEAGGEPRLRPLRPQPVGVSS